MAAKRDIVAARGFIPALETALNALPKWIWNDTAAYDQGLFAITNMIAAQNGNQAENWNGSWVHIHGFRATATAGLPQACRNWISQVQRDTTIRISAGAVQ